MSSVKSVFWGHLQILYHACWDDVCENVDKFRLRGKQKKVDYAMKCLISSFDKVPYVHDDKAMQTRWFYLQSICAVLLDLATSRCLELSVARVIFFVWEKDKLSLSFLPNNSTLTANVHGTMTTKYSQKKSHRVYWSWWNEMNNEIKCYCMAICML